MTSPQVPPASSLESRRDEGAAAALGSNVRREGSATQVLAAVAVGGGLLISLAIVLLHIRQGFDLTDESYYLLGLRHPEDARLTLSSYHQIIGRLAGLDHLSILQYRLLAVLINVVSSAALGSAVAWAWGGAHDVRRGARMLRAVLLAALGGMVQYSWGPRGLSYNVVNGALCYAECAVVLACAGAVRRGSALGLGLLAAHLCLGVLLGTHALVKATSGLLMGIVVLAGLWWTVPRGRRPWLLAALMAAVGLALVPSWFFLSVTRPGEWLATIGTVQHAMSSWYSARSIWRGSVLAALGSIRRAMPLVGLSAIFMLAASTLRSRGRKGPSLAAEAGAVLAVLALVLLSAHFPGGDDVVTRMWIPHFAAVAILGVAWLASRETRPLGAAGWLGSALLLGLPAAAAIGTTNILTVQMLFHLPPWFALIGIAHDGLGRVRTMLVTTLGPPLLALTVVAQVYVGQVLRPFGVHGTIGEQTIELPGEDRVAVGVRVDAATAQMVNDVRALLMRGGYAHGDVIWAICDTPGLVLLTGGRAPQTPWLQSGPGGPELTCEALRRTPPGPLPEFLVLSKDLAPAVADCMRLSGRPQESFELVGAVLRPPLPITKDVQFLRILVRKGTT